ncbi:DUF6762 family protein [Clostridium tunisiense]|jgi:hypothetical protein|uniref:DUF6762 family protein n=1 Tax=Clostridium tunisiense TaxID=219748 RepID=UPI0002DE5732|nr:DUF6762 family protein [Clostridium tunisiense]
MDFSSLVLMEKDKDTNYLTKEIGSYEVGEGAKYITKLFYDGENINLYFDTNKDVEEWEFTAIFDLFDEEVFKACGFDLQPYDEEYNPTWVIKFAYDEDYNEVKNKINEICSLINNAMDKVFKDISDKKQQYL